MPFVRVTLSMEMWLMTGAEIVVKRSRRLLTRSKSTPSLEIVSVVIMLLLLINTYQ